MDKSMMLISSRWGEKNSPTFKMIPTHQMCPFNECIFDPESKTLAVIGITRQQNYRMLIKIDENGDPEYLKNGKVRSGGKNYKEERRLVETLSEYYITDEMEIRWFVTKFAENAGLIDIDQYISSVKEETPAVKEPEPIVA